MRRFISLLNIVLVISLLVCGCTTPASEAIEKVVTRVVTEVVQEIVVVEGTPQVVVEEAATPVPATVTPTPTATPTHTPTSTPTLTPPLLPKVVDVQPYLWFVRKDINEYITCEDGRTRRYISKDEDELSTRVRVYYHVMEHKGQIYILYVYHWQYSMFFSVYAPGFGRIEIGNHCWDYEPVILVLDQDWTRLHAVYDAGHYDTEKAMAGRHGTGDIDLQVVKGTHAFSAEVNMQHSSVYRFPANRFIPLTIDKILDWQRQLQTLPPYGPHDLSLLDAYLFPWTVGPDGDQIDAFSPEVSAYVWKDSCAVGGARRLAGSVYPYAKCVLDRIHVEYTLKKYMNDVLGVVDLVDSAAKAVATYGVGPTANVLTMDPTCAPP